MTLCDLNKISIVIMMMMMMMLTMMINDCGQE